MNGKTFLMLSELFEQFRVQALALVKEAEQAGFLDDLTNCYNRRAFDIRLEQLQGLPGVCVMFVDVNGLKQVNDTQGHLAGDLVLKGLGKMLKAHFGGNDVFRVAGDEFLVLKANQKPKVFELLVEEFKATINCTHKTSVAIGCGCTSETKDLKSVLAETEQKMYADKKKFYQIKQIKN